MKTLALALFSATLTSCVTTTAPNGVVTRALDPAVTSAAIAIANTPEGKAIIDAAVAKAVSEINAATKP